MDNKDLEQILNTLSKMDKDELDNAIKKANDFLNSNEKKQK